MGRTPEGFRPFTPEEAKNPENQEKPNQAQVKWLTENVSIDSFRHGGGAGGQNKNKVSSAADLRWLVNDPKSDVPFSSTEKEMINNHFPKSKKGSLGEIHLTATRSRDFGENREKVLQRLISEVRIALNPDPDRIPTRPTRSSVERRLEDKKKTSIKTQRRQQKDFE